MRVTFKGEDAISLQSDLYEVVILPNRGAKIASILYKPLKLELLSQLPGKKYQSKPNPLHGFTSEDSTGFDDMFPSILAEEYIWDSGETTSIQDHGDVWYRAWECHSISPSECLSSIELTDFSCLLEKSIKIHNHGIQVAYALTNKSEAPFRGLWAAHALFAMRPGMFLEVNLPSVEIINAMENSALGENAFGKRYTYTIPSAAWEDVAVFNPNSRSCAKYYFSPSTVFSRCSIIDKQNSIAIHVDFDSEITPYVGIWKNEKGWEGQMNIGIEPATSGMDAPSLAKEFGMGKVFPAHETTVWDLQISVEPTT